MPADIKNGSFARPVTLAPTQPADSSLSAAFRQALGGKAADDHLRNLPPIRGQEIAKLAKTDKPGSPARVAPRKAHIGPRSGHK